MCFSLAAFYSHECLEQQLRSLFVLQCQRLKELGGLSCPLSMTARGAKQQNKVLEPEDLHSASCHPQT